MSDREKAVEGAWARARAAIIRSVLAREDAEAWASFHAEASNALDLLKALALDAARAAEARDRKDG